MMRRVELLANGCVPYIQGFSSSQLDNNQEGTWDIYDDTLVKPLLKNLRGQHQYTSLGKSIFKLASHENGPTSWLEVGTWNGNGTTINVLQGFMLHLDKEKLHLITYECHPLMYDIAKENLEIHPLFQNHLTMINGRLPGAFHFPLESEIPETDKYRGSHYCIAYELEKASFLSAKEVAPFYSPEAVILDGGLYSGLFDWQALDKSALRYVFLDDVNTVKHQKVFAELHSKKDEWILEDGSETEGNGWAFFTKKKSNA